MEEKTSSANPLTEALIKEGGKIQGFEIRKGLEEVDYDLESWLDVIRIFIDTTPGFLETLKVQCEENDPEYAVTVHGIKGVCYSVGAAYAGDKARELELRSKERDTAFVRTHTGSLISIIEKLIADLSKLSIWNLSY
jgi:HPt (histidine-containing phosphotransfer) domain-containing protein